MIFGKPEEDDLNVICPEANTGMVFVDFETFLLFLEYDSSVIVIVPSFNYGYNLNLASLLLISPPGIIHLQLSASEELFVSTTVSPARYSSLLVEKSDTGSFAQAVNNSVSTRNMRKAWRYFFIEFENFLYILVVFMACAAIRCLCTILFLVAYK